MGYKVIRKGGMWYVVNTQTGKTQGRGYKTAALASGRIGGLKSKLHTLNNPGENSPWKSGSGAVLTAKPGQPPKKAE